MGEGVNGTSMRLVYLLEGTDLCGGVKVVLEQADSLLRFGHRVIVLSKGPSPVWFPLQAEFRQVAEFGRDLVPEADFIIGTYWTTVLPAVAAGRGTPVHLCQGYEGDLYPEGEERTEIEALHRLQAHLIPSPEECLQLRMAIEAAYHLPTLKVTVAPHLKALIESRFGQPCHNIGNGIDLQRFTSVEARPPGSRSRILVVGPWEWPVKGIPYALESVRRLRQWRQDFHVVRASQLPQSAAEQALGIVDEYHCRVAPSAMPDLYRGCDLLVSASTEAEGFGLAALEAMACGVPCVLSAIPAYLDFGGGRICARFVPPRNPDALAQAVDEILGDRGLWGALRTAGLEVASQYSVEAVAKRLELLLWGATCLEPWRAP